MVVPKKLKPEIDFVLIYISIFLLWFVFFSLIQKYIVFANNHKKKKNIHLNIKIHIKINVFLQLKTTQSQSQIDIIWQASIW
jgi:hypothetical protein